ncbi:hypothetical protein NDGK_01863 [Clostridiales bacterium CHKCI001]|nr:hypothetical protein NDGK_01863 [Clostridiales bacterium CHKCI001]
MNNTLYLECSSGISGDMFVAALLDLGADSDILMNVLNHLPVNGFNITIQRVKKAGLDACDFTVHLEQENHDHDMEYLHGKKEVLSEEHHHHNGADHCHKHDHPHKHLHEHSEHSHPHEHRGITEIFQIIDQADMTSRAKELARKIFQIIGEAEAKAHGVPMDQVHFHEVGAIDSIVDIIAAAVCMDNLNIEDVIISQLNEGKGSVRCQHGILPVPVPAVTNIIAAHQLPIHIMDCEGEFITPTGAAIAAAIRTSSVLPESFFIQKIGLGAGKRTYERPSLLRAMLIQSPTTEKQDEIYKLETNIDDCSGEALGYTMERLFEAGARDVFYHSIYMKKNRPAYQLNVICDETNVEKLEQIIFEETTTIGIRKIKMERSILNRSIQEVKLEYGTVKVKQCELPNGSRYYPEYESVAELSRKYQIPYQQMYQKVLIDCKEMLERNSSR